MENCVILGSISNVPETLLQQLRPLWEAALKAFLTDPAYAIEMAQAGREQSVTRTEELALSGV